MKVNISNAKAKFSKLVARAERGYETVITRNGTAVARLVPAAKRSPANPNAAVMDRIARFSKMLKLPRRVDLRALIEAGRR